MGDDMSADTARTTKAVLLIGTLLAGAAAGCATTGFVTTQVGEVNGKVDSVIDSLEENQELTRLNEERIALVGNRTSAAYVAANRAQRSADAAGVRAGSALRKVNTLDLALSRVVYEVALSEAAEGFAFNSASVPAPAKARLDEIVARIKAHPNGAYFEIEGHTDDVGARTLNERVGLARAEAVKRYLHERHEIPLHRINVISYGEDKPLAPNTTAAGRAQNRRVVVRVLV
jgi:outer membrane protein OmpA-like peptidoglycan-associated protein